MVTFEDLPNFSKGQTISLAEMNKYLAVGVENMNDLKDKLSVIQLNRHMSPHDSYAYSPATSLKEALDTIKKQRDEIATLKGHIQCATDTKAACLKADNDPKYAVEFVDIVKTLGLREIGMVNEWAKQKGLKPPSPPEMKWHERMYAWLLQK